MIKTSHVLAPLALTLFCSAALAQASGEPAAAEASAHTLTGNLSLVSDYRFRGIAQSWRQPAVQGGFDYTHASGWYLGNWNSSVSSNSYNNGASLEVDLYGGYRFDLAPEWGADLGLLHYLYPSARLNSAPAQPSANAYDNTELYAGLSHGPFSAKLSYAVSDYFGLKGDTAAYAYWSALPNRGGSRGSTYLDLNYNLDLGDQLTLGLHLGHTSVHHYGELSYTDYKIGLTQDWHGLNLGAALVGSNADTAYYQAGNSAGADARKLGRPSVVLSLGKTF